MGILENGQAADAALLSASARIRNIEPRPSRRIAQFGLRMISTATMRRLGPWLVGLYVLAMVAGVMPLIRACNAHAVAPLGVSESSAPVLPQGHHHAGDVDDLAHHHALQDLTGVLDWRPAGAALAAAHTVMIAFPARALAEADPVLLERPPKAFLSI
jgi:hypothetical protein